MPGVSSQWVHGAKVCLIPHPLNNYQPLLLGKKSMALVSALLIAVKVAALSVVALTPVPAELSTITTARIVQLTNAERVKAGLNPLAISPQLSRAAEAKAADILEHDYFAHISPVGVTPWFWMQQQGYEYEVAGENLAIDFVEAEDVVSAWIASPSHKDNMLHNRYAETGVAVLTGEFEGSSSTVVVHMFGLPTGGNAVAGVVTAPASEDAAVAQEEVVLVQSPSPSPVPASPLPSVALVAAVEPEDITVSEDPVPQVSEVFIVSPATDVPLAGIAGTTQTVGLEEEQLSPAFYIDRTTEYLHQPATFNQLVRRVSAALAGIVIVLLFLAVMIHVRVQHPRMIARVSLVLLLAGALIVL